MLELSPRQIHLDFHTSEYIDGIAAQFDPDEFARTAKAASVSAITAGCTTTQSASLSACTRT